LKQALPALVDPVDGTPECGSFCVLHSLLCVLQCILILEGRIKSFKRTQFKESLKLEGKMIFNLKANIFKLNKRPEN
jgi:hypothetical protein